MKKLLTITLLSCSLLRADTIVNFKDLSSEQLNAKLQCVVIEFSENSQLPLQLLLSGNLIESQSESTITVKQGFYVKFVEDTFLFSTDLAEWKPFTEFATGKIGVVLSVQEKGPSILFQGENNLR